jgi:hypothetical protein
MKESGKRWNLNSSAQLAAFIEGIRERIALRQPTTVCFLEADRTPNQNALLWEIIRQVVAAGKGDTESEVQQYIKLHFGVPILRSVDDEFRDIYDARIKPLPYPQKKALMSLIEVSSKLNKGQFSRMLDQAIEHYQAQDYRIHLDRV